MSEPRDSITVNETKICRLCPRNAEYLCSNILNFIGLSTKSCQSKDLNDGCETNAGDRRKDQNVAFHWERQLRWWRRLMWDLTT